MRSNSWLVEVSVILGYDQSPCLRSQVGWPSRFAILDLVENHSVEEVIDTVEGWKSDLRLIMCALSCRNLQELKSVPYLLFTVG